jgi:hypothetical protein
MSGITIGRRGWTTRTAIAAVLATGLLCMGLVIVRNGVTIATAASCLPAPQTITRVLMPPASIAPFGSLQAGQSVTFSATALSGKNCVSGATLKINMSGNSLVSVSPAQCGGATHLSGTSINCTTDSNGQVTMTFTASNPLPTMGSIEVNATGGSVTGHVFYLYEYLYRFSASPIAASGSLAASASVPLTLQVAGPDGTPTVGVSVMLSLTSTASPAGTAFVGATQLTSSAKSFTTDSAGQIQITYNTPSSLSASGVDNVVAGSSSGATPVVSNTTSYAYAAGYPTVSVGDVAQVDGDQHPDINALFDVSLSAPQASPVTVKYITVCGLGDKGCKEDYLQTLQPNPKTVTFASGQVMAVISVHIYSYPAPEPYPETFFIQLLNPSGAILGHSLGDGTIIQDNEADLAQRIYVGDTGVVRSTSGNQLAQFTVTLAAPQSGSVTFTYATADGTAFAGTDYTAVSGTGTITANNTSTYIQVPILPGAIPGVPLTYTVTISNITGGAILTRATGSGAIS